MKKSEGDKKKSFKGTIKYSFKEEGTKKYSEGTKKKAARQTLQMFLCSSGPWKN